MNKEEMNMVFEKVAGMIAKQLRLDVSEVTADKRLVFCS